MLFRYRMNSSCTYANMKADITGIITGTITSTGGLSAGADTANCAVYGAYPTGTYAISNSGTSTYSKVHNAYNTTTHYIRIGWDGSTGITSISLANSYTSGTDTLVNSYSYSVSITLQKYNTIDIIVNTNCFIINSFGLGSGVGIYDIGKSGITRAYTTSTLMCMWDITTFNSSIYTPYMYNLQTVSYASMTNGADSTITPVRLNYNTTNISVIENPVLIYWPSNGNSANSIYAVNKINDTVYIQGSVYSDSSSVYRYVISNTNEGFSITIT